MSENNKFGFTLIELLIAMAIFSIVMASVFSAYIASSRTANVQNASAAAQQAVRVGIDLMTQDIRMAGYDPLQTSGASIAISQPVKIQVTSDRNANGVINDANFERVTYDLVGGSLRRILYEGSGIQQIQPLIDNVTSLVFTYSGNCNVTIVLEVTESAGRSDPVSRSLETTVYCRNLDL
ncbi:MAG: prepilin-type N-terminal cleavage/methylation domain-containing protein [Desulfobacterales bacterium]|nr:prepilin-type N-terminal cleavage/methylation domain-containing protein [Desulfobacterales bacterium]